MTWIEKHFGLDGVDLAVHAGVTMCAVGITSILPHNLGILLGYKVVALSLILFGWRRHRAIKRRAADGSFEFPSGERAAQRFEDVEFRLAELEAAQAKVADLEDRLDFAERRLARAEPTSLLPGSRDG